MCMSSFTWCSASTKNDVFLWDVVRFLLLWHLYNADYEDKEFPVYEAGNLGEQISNDYLEELLRGFPFNKESKDRRPDDAAGAGDSDGEYQIFEQDSDDNENFLDDDDGFS